MDQDFSVTWQRCVLFDFAVDARRGHRLADTTQVQEIDGYGQFEVNWL
jgi:hypothetical protein